jgi:peptide/nickel transport system ATP-binding protein
MIAMALACNPKIIIADEPVTALDVMIQAQILELLKELRERLDLSMILISHDLSVIAETCDKVAIMYGGKLAEFGPSKDVFRDPQHPYTQGLLKSFPDIYGPRDLPPWIPGQPPNLLDPPTGCRFHPRCAYAFDECQRSEPQDFPIDANHTAACFLRAAR